MFCVGASLLVALYFDLGWLVYTLIGLMLFEGLTNLRAAHLFRPAAASKAPCPVPESGRRIRVDFDAQRAWHLIMATVLLVSYVLFYSKLWVFTWFVGFAVTGAGLSGVCPVLMLLKASGFK
jgi:hypothetical protein